MSNIVVAAARTTEEAENQSKLVDGLADRLDPGPLARRFNAVMDRGWVQVLVMGGCPATLRENASALSGAIRDPEGEWWQVGAPAPEGSYVLARSDEDQVEVLGDFAGSRSIWYYADGERFFASTSQRAIVALLGGFEANDKALPWLLSSGSIGYQNAWDRRLKLLPPNSRLILTRDTWRVRTDLEQDRFGSQLDDPEELLSELKVILQDMRLDPKLWAISLSGGCDSRALMGCVPPGDWRTISWGTGSADKAGSDLCVAQEVADHYQTRHRAFHLPVMEDPEKLLALFVQHGEGRTDKLAGYVDGFELWKQVIELGIEGIIRGDELFGSNYAPTYALSWANMGLGAFKDFAGTPETRAMARMYPQEHPSALRRVSTESMAAWRNRLRVEYEQPVVLAALNQIRSCFVEMANPLLSGSLVTAAAGWGDRMTINKAFFNRQVAGLIPGLAFARRASIIDRPSLYAQASFKELLIDQLSSRAAQGLLPKKVKQRVIDELQVPSTSSVQRLATKVRRAFALRELRFSIKGALPVFELRDLALRVHITLAAKEMFTLDGQFGVSDKPIARADMAMDNDEERRALK